MRRLGGVLAGVVLAAGSLVVVGVAPAGATTTITVTSNADTAGPCPSLTGCTLRQAFVEASSGGSAQGDDVEIVIQPGVGTITLGSTLSYDGGSGSSHAMTIQGNGATVQGGGSFPLIFNGSSGSLTIDGLTLTKGVGSNGGAIVSIGAVTVTNSTFTNNQASGPGGAIFSQNGPVTVSNSTFTGNTASGGGAIFAAGGAVTVSNSTFTGNQASDDGGAIFAAGGAVTVTDSTFTGNTAVSGEGGAIYQCGTIRCLVGVTLFAGNSTFTNNHSGAAGGAIYSAGAMTVAYSTFTGNTAGADCLATQCSQVPLGGSALSSSFSSITSFGSVLIKPSGTSPLCAAPSVSSAGYSYANETANSCGLNATGDSSLDANDPLLGALASNGGPTQTRLPQSGSPLIDAIPNAACQTSPLATGIATDQRGLARPEQSGGKCDIGAVEVQLPPAPAPVEVVIRFTG